MGYLRIDNLSRPALRYIRISPKNKVELFMISQKINATPTQSTQFQILNASQCDDIFYAALRILECTGCHVFSEKALQIFQEAGAHCSGDQVKIPSFLVEKAISTAPKQIILYTTEGEPYLNLCAKLNTRPLGYRHGKPFSGGSKDQPAKTGHLPRRLRNGTGKPSHGKH